MISSVIATSFSILPSWVVITILGILSIIVLFLVIKLVSFVLDAIPFL